MRLLCKALRSALLDSDECINDSLILKHIINQHNLSEESVLGILAEELNMEIGHVLEVELEDHVKELLSYEFVEKYNVFPISITDDEAEIAISDPFNLDITNLISHILNRPVILRLATEDDIKNSIGTNYEESSDSINAAFSEATEALAGGNSPSPNLGDGDDSPIVRYVHSELYQKL